MKKILNIYSLAVIGFIIIIIHYIRAKAQSQNRYPGFVSK